jgi:wyosine [tRNA(Phe)-imidazoG37] synthetase (radical SAM superfamily)
VQCEKMDNSMTGYQHLFGPVPSRRFGRSLGVDLTPYKTCSHDCVFCQLGRTTHKTVHREDYVSLEAVIEELSDWIKAGGEADYITLSGSGEPTLHARFGEVLKYIRSKSRLPAVLLTNGSLFHLTEVRKETRHADIVKISLSAWDQSSYVWVNRPHPDLRFDQIVEGQKAFRNEFRRQIWMEVFLVAGMNSNPADVSRISRLAEQIRPDRIHLNTAVRPPAEEFVAPLSQEKLSSLAGIFHPTAEVIAAFQAGERGKKRGSLEKIHGMLERRPCTADDIAYVFGMHINEVLKYLGKLLQEGRIRHKRMNDVLYYTASNKEQSERDAQRSKSPKKTGALTIIDEIQKNNRMHASNQKL